MLYYYAHVTYISSQCTYVYAYTCGKIVEVKVIANLNECLAIKIYSTMYIQYGLSN